MFYDLTAIDTYRAETAISHTDGKSDVTDKHFVRVDVTEEFPFLLTKLSPYYDRT
jgi:hypothetical protein